MSIEQRETSVLPYLAMVFIMIFPVWRRKVKGVKVPCMVGLLACQAERSSAAHLQRPPESVRGWLLPRYGEKRRPGGLPYSPDRNIDLIAIPVRRLNRQRQI